MTTSNSDAQRDQPSVTANGSPIRNLIDGLIVRELSCHPDHRGEVSELYRLDWNCHPMPVTSAVLVTLHPGVIKGWHLHEESDDRNIVVSGFTRWGFFDDRPDSPTRGRLNVVTVTERRRAVIVIPRLVWHAVENVGSGEAILVNLPTGLYEHGRPDKIRLPIKNDLIPFDFSSRHG